jgi:hypothetical protein
MGKLGQFNQSSTNCSLRLQRGTVAIRNQRWSNPKLSGRRLGGDSYQRSPSLGLRSRQEDCSPIHP